MTEKNEINTDTKFNNFDELLKWYRDKKYKEGYKSEFSIPQSEVDENAKLDSELKKVINKYFIDNGLRSDNLLIKEFDNELMNLNRKYDKLLVKAKDESEKENIRQKHDSELQDFINKIFNEAIKEDAIVILKSGDPLEYIMNTANIFHKSDKWLKYIMHCSIICSSIKGSNGVQPYLTGEKGMGKTHLADTFKHLAPEGKVIKATFSDKALFYATKEYEDRIGKEAEGLIIYSDDVELTPGFEDLIKRATSDFQNRTVYYTVTDKKRTKLEIPAKTVWWLTSVDTARSEQLKDRFINVGIDESDETTKDVQILQFLKAAESKEAFEKNYNVLVCRNIYELINNEKSEIYFHTENIDKLPSDKSRRSGPILFDIVKCITATYFMQRNDVPTDKDWKLALEIWNNISETNILKLNPSEVIINKLIPYEPDRISQGQIRIELMNMGKKLEKGRISQIINGRKVRGEWKEGLVDKLSLNVYREGNEKYYSKVNVVF